MQGKYRYMHQFHKKQFLKIQVHEVQAESIQVLKYSMAVFEEIEAVPCFREMIRRQVL